MGLYYYNCPISDGTSISRYPSVSQAQCNFLFLSQLIIENSPEGPDMVVGEEAIHQEPLLQEQEPSDHD